MGALGKYVAYRWVTRGEGGSGGSGALVIFMAIFVGILLIVYALQTIFEFILSTIYATVRPVLLLAPNVSAIVGGILLAGVIAIIARYPPETAREILQPSESVGTGWFYLKCLLLVGFINGYMYALLISESDSVMASWWLRHVTGNALVHLVGNLVGVVVFFYVLYKLVHLPYRYHRLVKYAPYGAFLTVLSLLPVTVGIVPTAFDLTTGIPELPPAIMLNIPYVLPLVFVKFGAEPRILAHDQRGSEAGSSADGDGGSRRSEQKTRDSPGNTYVCLDCGMELEASSHPRTCDECDGVVKRDVA